VEIVRYAEIDEAIAYILEHIDEPLPLARIATHVGYSPFHFTRIFKERIGVPPLYYASALRLQRAKELLLKTNLSIRDVGLEIGQQSLGTFTTRFTEKVGMTPAQFRHSSLRADGELLALRLLKEWRKPEIRLGEAFPSIEGHIVPVTPFDGFVLIGLFAKPIPEGLPIYGTLVRPPFRFSFRNVNPGTYYLMATSISWGMKAMDFMLPRETLRTRSRSPIVVKAQHPVPYQVVAIHPPLPDDPPILISLPLLMNRFMREQASQISNP